MLCASPLPQHAPFKSDMSHSLFDMDGTLVDSKAGVESAWETFAETYPNLDVQKILHSALYIYAPSDFDTQLILLYQFLMVSVRPTT
jgi:phosphoglycolate phosphatase-like HAD superfamily hydrolase